jgi:hypothetical protein
MSNVWTNVFAFFTRPKSQSTTVQRFGTVHKDFIAVQMSVARGYAVVRMRDRD